MKRASTIRKPRSSTCARIRPISLLCTASGLTMNSVRSSATFGLLESPYAWVTDGLAVLPAACHGARRAGGTGPGRRRAPPHGRDALAACAAGRRPRADFAPRLARAYSPALEQGRDQRGDLGRDARDRYPGRGERRHLLGR